MPQHLHEIEHRWGERFSMDLPVQVALRALSGIDGRMKNLSLSGALIEAQYVLRLHALIEISMRLPTPCQREVAIKAHVVRNAHAEVGIEWCEFAPSAVKELLRTIAPGSRAIAPGR